MSERPKVTGTYFLFYALATAFLIRTVILWQGEIEVPGDIALLDNPSFYLALSGISFAIGLFVRRAQKNRE